MTKNNNRFGKDESTAKNKRIVGLLTLIFLVGGFQIATQYFAQKFNYQPQLGAHFNTIYEPWAILIWADKWYDQYPDIFELAASFGVLFSGVGLISAPFFTERDKNRQGNRA